MASYKETWVAGPHSTNFYTRTYEAESPVALLVNVHGAPEHSGRYTHAHSLLAEHGTTVFSYDQRGFGRTALDTEHKSKDSAYGKTNWNAALEDLDWAVQYAHQRYPELPVFIMGESMVSCACGCLQTSSSQRTDLGRNAVCGLCGAPRTAGETSLGGTSVRRHRVRTYVPTHRTSFVAAACRSEGTQCSGPIQAVAYETRSKGQSCNMWPSILS